MLEILLQSTLKQPIKLAAIVRVAERICAACILRNTVMIDGTPSVIFREELFDFPISLFGADTEFEIFFGNGVPILSNTLALIPRGLCLPIVTLYTIMTARRLQIVAKNNPST